MADTVFGERMLIAKGNIAETSLDTTVPRAAANGEVLFKVDRIALTANNVTYAAAGDMMGYWRFFPGPEGSGILPVWGFGDAVESRAAGIASGDRFYGYWPLAAYLVVEADNVSKQGFSDKAPHRQGLSDFYNRYTRVPADRSVDDEAIEALFRPLFMTGWLIDIFLGEADDFGASQVILSSASSKTALACAFSLARRKGVKPKIVGLTSAANRSFVEGLGSYDQVLTYDDLDALDAAKPSVYVDFAGDRELTFRVHIKLGDALKHSAIIGMTHWASRQGEVAIPGPTPTLFFAPTVAEATVKALGPAGFAEASGAAWSAFVPHARDKLDIEFHAGLPAAETLYGALASGNIGGPRSIVVDLG